MKKIKMIFSLILLLLTLCGCLKVDVKYSIDEKYKVTLVYDVEMDLETLDSDILADVKRFYQLLVRNYEALGFEVKGDYEENIDFTLTLEKQASSYEEAYEMLKEIITNPKYSLFTVVDMSASIEEYEQAFNFYFETDLSKIVESTELGNLPPSIRNRLYEGMDVSEISLSLTLPFSNVVEANDAVEVTTSGKKTTFTIPLNWDEPSIMDLVVRMSLDGNKMTPYPIEKSIQNTKDTIGMYRMLFFGGIGAAVLAAGGFIFMLMRKKKAV